ncbi:MAG: SCO family protein [Halioglobus sp.]
MLVVLCRLAVTFILIAWACGVDAAQPAADNPFEGMAEFFIASGKSDIDGSLDNLTFQGNANLREAGRHYTLIYFGTSYRVGSCATDLLSIHHAIDLLENRCGAEMADRVRPILVYPEGDIHMSQEARNLKTYVDVPDARFVARRGPASEVFALAQQYGAHYDLDDKGLVVAHTRFSYLMSSSGKNLAIFDGGTPFSLTTERLIQQFQKDGLLQGREHSRCLGNP